jgi:hypothetical protein
MGFCAKLASGSLADGTANVQAVILYGKASFAASGRGRHSSPTTAMRKAFEAVFGAAWVRDADEHRSTKCCSYCYGVLDKVWAQTPERVYAAAEARAARQLPWGWSRPPPRPVAGYRVVRGELRCPSDACRARSFRHRDVDAARLIYDNAFAFEATGAPLACMARGRHDEDPPGRFYLPRG